jgi:hypothetical protein
MVVGVVDATNIDMGISVLAICAPMKYTFDGTFVVSQTRVLVPAPVTPVE